MTQDPSETGSPTSIPLVQGAQARATAPPPHPLDKQWFIYLNGAASGPCSGHQIRQMKEEGRFAESDFLCPVGGTAWIMAKDDVVLGGLFPRPAQMPPSPPNGPVHAKEGATVVQVTNMIHAPNPDLVDGLLAAPKSPGVALLLSFLICGVGQMYNGQVGRGFLFLFGCAFAWVILLGWVIWIWGMVDAYSTAKQMSLRYQRQMIAGLR